MCLLLNVSEYSKTAIITIVTIPFLISWYCSTVSGGILSNGWKFEILSGNIIVTSEFSGIFGISKLFIFFTKSIFHSKTFLTLMAGERPKFLTIYFTTGVWPAHISLAISITSKPSQALSEFAIWIDACAVFLVSFKVKKIRKPPITQKTHWIIDVHLWTSDALLILVFNPSILNSLALSSLPFFWMSTFILLNSP